MGLVDQYRHARAVYRNHDRLIDLQERFDTATEAVDRAVLALQIQDRLELQAEHLAASRLARAVTALPSPGVLRAEAAEWGHRSDALFAEAARVSTHPIDIIANAIREADATGDVAPAWFAGVAANTLTHDDIVANAVQALQDKHWRDWFGGGPTRNDLGEIARTVLGSVAGEQGPAR